MFGGHISDNASILILECSILASEGYVHRLLLEHPSRALAVALRLLNDACLVKGVREETELALSRVALDLLP